MKGTESTDSINIALIGSGPLAKYFFLPAIQEYYPEYVNLVLVDNELKQANEITNEFDLTETGRSYNEYLHTIDAAILSNPSLLNCNQIIDILEKGTHVLAELPITTQEKEMKRIENVARLNNVTFLANNLLKLFPTHLRVKEMINNNAIGKLKSFQLTASKRPHQKCLTDQIQISSCVQLGVIAELGSHIFNLLCWWIEGTPRVTSARSDSFGGLESVAKIEFQNKDCPGFVVLNRLFKERETYRLNGTEGTISGFMDDGNKLFISNTDEDMEEINIKSDFANSYEIPQIILNNFFECIVGNKTSRVVDQSIYNSLSIFRQVYNQTEPFDMPWMKYE